MAFVRTVLGDIDPAELGVCHAHEHVVIARSHMTQQWPVFLHDDEGKIVEELRSFRAAGGRAMVDASPGDAGRDAAAMARVSQQSGVHVVAATGMHLVKYYADPAAARSVDALTDTFVDEIVRGMDRTEHRAGVIKVAGSRDALSEWERRTFVAAARAQVATGCPILTHTEEGTAALEQVELLSGNGADLRHVVLSHLDRNRDVDHHRAVLKTGVRLEYDSAFRWKQEQGNPTLDLLVELLPAFPEQIMLGMDAARASYWASYGGGPGLTYLLTTFAGMLRERGIGRDLIDQMFIYNPKAAFAFGRRSEP